mmetsp:Transcript_1175/g.3877  ORF Transcript_1175/g.3877 Transcript_1175/m.3877 type:complete len:200 (-) Transcript_1175:2401-3000(-)
MPACRSRRCDGILTARSWRSPALSPPPTRAVSGGTFAWSSSIRQMVSTCEPSKCPARPCRRFLGRAARSAWPSPSTRTSTSQTSGLTTAGVSSRTRSSTPSPRPSGTNQRCSSGTPRQTRGSRKSLPSRSSPSTRRATAAFMPRRPRTPPISTCCGSVRPTDPPLTKSTSTSSRRSLRSHGTMWSPPPQMPCMCGSTVP